MRNMQIKAWQKQEKVNPATGIFYCKNWLGYHDSISLEESLPMTSTQEALRAEDLPKLGAEE